MAPIKIKQKMIREHVCLISILWYFDSRTILDTILMSTVRAEISYSILTEKCHLCSCKHCNKEFTTSKRWLFALGNTFHKYATLHKLAMCICLLFDHNQANGYCIELLWRLGSYHFFYIVLLRSLCFQNLEILRWLSLFQ